MPGIEVVSGIQKKFSRAAAKCEKCFAAALLCLVFCVFGAYSSNHGLWGRSRPSRTQAGGKRIPRKRGQGIRKLTPKNVRVHRESALHLALSKEWIFRTSLTAPQIVCFVIRFHPACCILTVQTHKNTIHH